MTRNMIRVKPALGWACSDCGWVFAALGPPRGDTLNEMMRNFEAQRDKEFMSHICIRESKTQRHKRPKKTE
jgi:hypothetical protein